jgi:hypothetical protein
MIADKCQPMLCLAFSSQSKASIIILTRIRKDKLNVIVIRKDWADINSNIGRGRQGEKITLYRNMYY